MSEGARESISGEDNTPPPPEATETLPVQSWNSFVQPADPTFESRKGLDLRDSLTDNALDLESAGDEIKRRRREAGDLVGGPQDAVRTTDPIKEHRVDSGRVYRDAREASDDLAFSRMRAAREELQGQGWNDEQLNALAYAASTRQASLVDPKTGLEIEGPPPAPSKVGLADQYGNELSKLGNWVTPDDALNPKKAAELLGNWREAQAKAQAEELAALQGEQQQQEYQQYQEPEPQPEPQERTVEAFSQEHADRAALAQERAYVAQIGNMSLAEAGALSDLHRLDQWTQANLPEVAQLRQLMQSNPAQANAELERMRVNAPARFQALQKVDAEVRQHQARLAHASEQRGLIQSRYEQQARQATMATLKGYRDQQDQLFDQRASAISAEWQDPNARREIRDQVSKMFKDAGLTKEQVNGLWHSDWTLDIHHPAAQEALLKAALWDRAQARMHNLNAQRAPVPPVQRPGTYRPAGAGDIDRVNDLSRQLDGATSERQALKIAAQLTRARRALNTGGH